MGGLGGGDIAQWKRDRNQRITLLLRWTGVRLHPFLEFRGAQERPFAGRLEREFLEGISALQIFGPARIGWQVPALRQNGLPEFLDPPILDQKLDPCPAAILLFAVFGENARNCLRKRQQLLRRGKYVEEVGLITDRAEPAANVHFEPNLPLSIFHLLRGNQAQVVHARQPAGVLTAAAE